MAYPYPAAAPADPTAVIGRRIGSFFIDVAVFAVVGLLIFFPLATKRTVDETLDLPGCHRKLADTSQVECTNRAVFQVGDNVYEADGGPTFGLMFAFTLLYFGVLPGLTGATLGKALTGIRVVDATGAIANIGRSLLRWLLFAVDGPFSLYLCGLLTFLLSKGHRRLGDMAAGTYVVAKDAVGRPVTIASAAPAYAAAPYGAPPPPPAASAPQWDAARGAYVQWDPQQGRYLTFNQTTQTWE